MLDVGHFLLLLYINIQFAEYGKLVGRRLDLHEIRDAGERMQNVLSCCFGSICRNKYCGDKAYMVGEKYYRDVYCVRGIPREVERRNVLEH